MTVEVSGLGKRYGDQWALRDLDLSVPKGTILGLLGHNGAGKTTTIRILTTLSEPTEGTASVAGFDVAKHPGDVRRRIGVAAQQQTVDGLLSARLNLEMVGRLNGFTKKEARARAEQLLVQFDLVESTNKLAKALSGGMRRRLDLAASLITRPEVLFLDEPTTGLDPRSRNDLWAMLRDIVRDGSTIILTTQYLEEADRLADDVVVLDHGRTVAHGTPLELKQQIGNDRIDIKVRSEEELSQVQKVGASFATNAISADVDLLVATVPVAADARLIDIVRLLDENGIDAVDINRRQASLDDVFLSLTTPKGMTR
nr:daunorubicin resistance ABC transporter, ATP-binding protein [uncultured bacterium]